MYANSWEDFLLLIGLRYFIIATIAWFIWYVWQKNKIAYKKIQLSFPRNRDYRREILNSVVTIYIFSLVPSVLLLTSIRQYTQFYIYKPGDEKHVFFWLVFPLMFIIHDAYFYFTHRLMHHPKIFRHVHLTHHKSTNPSPYAAFAFHPLEAIIEAGIFPLLLFTMPMCRWHLFFFFLVQMVYNVYGHLGWELYPKNFNKNWFGKWINTSVCHNQHHHYFIGNYGLYFLWWDRFFGTLRDDYDTTFNEVKNRKQEMA